MELWSRSLGFRLIAVSGAIVACAVVLVAVVVGKMSEDDVKSRLLLHASEVALAVEGASNSGATPEDLGLVVSLAKTQKAGGAWVLDREGRFVGPHDARFRRFLEGGGKFGDVEVELSAVYQPLDERGPRVGGSRVPLRSVLDQYQSGFGKLDIAGKKSVVAFQSLRDRGWLIGVDEPYSETSSTTASLKYYILWACGILGGAILVSTALSMSLIIKPYYREKLELSSRIEEANRNLKKLHELSVGMQQSQSLEGKIDGILGAAREVLRVDRILIFLPNEAHTMLECRGAFGNQDETPSEIAVPIGDEGGLLAKAFQKRRRYHVAGSGELKGDMRLRAPYAELKALRSRNFVVLPMVVENHCVGVVAVDNQLTKKPLTPELVERLELFTNQAAVAIENGRLYQQLKLYANELEVTDHLTQLFTFVHFKKLLQAEIERSKVLGQTFSLLVLGIENFAEYNDRHGHKHGDDVLRQVSACLREAVEKQAVVGRCFGSTFAAVLPGVDEAGAEALRRELVESLGGGSCSSPAVASEGELHFIAAVGEYRRGGGWEAEDFFADVRGRCRGEG